MCALPAPSAPLSMSTDLLLFLLCDLEDLDCSPCENSECIEFLRCWQHDNLLRHIQINTKTITGRQTWASVSRGETNRSWTFSGKEIKTSYEVSELMLRDVRWDTAVTEQLEIWNFYRRSLTITAHCRVCSSRICFIFTCESKVI